MNHKALKERARKRLATIKATADAGVYARHYAEDVDALLTALEEEEARLKDSTPPT